MDRLAGWAVPQIELLAPDAASLKAGRALASPGKWSGLGRSDRVLWGLCQGSGKDPYRTQIDLEGPAFKCSCPSRKFPCKHGLGLFLLILANPSAADISSPPDWVTEWLTQRDSRAQKQAEKEPAPPSAAVVDEEGRARRSAQREARVAEGIELLDQWLTDQIRTGLSSFPAYHSPGHLPAARLIDCQCPGLARRVQLLTELRLSGEGWQSRLLAEMGRLRLLISAYRRMDALPDTLKAEVRTQIGWTQDQERLLAEAPGVQDLWRVVGQSMDDDGRVRVQRTWLLGDRSGSTALLLAFGAGAAPLVARAVVGTEFEGELAYFPGAIPLRALIRRQAAPSASDLTRLGTPELSSALRGFGAAAAANPWLDRWPIVVREVVPALSEDRVWVVDRNRVALPLLGPVENHWQLLAVSGGGPLWFSGEWDGEALQVMAFCSVGSTHASVAA